MAFPTNDDIYSYTLSSKRTTLIQKLQNCNMNTKLTTNEIVLMSGFLLIELSLENASRISDIEKLTVDHIYRGDKNDAGDLQVQISSNSCMISKPLLHMIINYLRFIRPRLLKRNTNNVFLKCSGSEVDCNSTKFYMGKMWRDCGLTSKVEPRAFYKLSIPPITERF